MSDLQAWVHWAEQQMAHVAIQERLHVGMAGVLEGPTTLTFRLRLRNISTTTVNRMLNMHKPLGSALQVGNVRIQNSAEGFLVEIPHPSPWTPAAPTLARMTRQHHNVAIGIDSYRKPVYWQMRRNPHLLLIGPTQRGKTTGLKSILAAMSNVARPGDFAFVVLAQKVGPWRQFARLAACQGLILESEEIEAYSRWIVERLNERSRHGNRRPTWITVVDDAHDISQRADITPLSRIASAGAEIDMHLVVTTQNSGRKGGVGAFENNMTTRLVYGAASAADAARFTGGGGMAAHVIGGTKGDALYIVDGTPTRIATAYLPERWLATLPTNDKNLLARPWTDSLPDISVATAATNTGVGSSPLPPPLASGALGVTPPTGGGSEVVYTGVSGVTPVLGGVSGVDSAPPDTTPTPLAQRPTPLTQRLTPLPATRLPSPTEAAYIAAYAATHSLNETCRHCYGSKNPKTAALVKHAAGWDLSERDNAQLQRLDSDLALAAQSTAVSVPDLIDLNDPAGRQLLTHLQKSGDITWPSDSTEAA